MKNKKILAFVMSMALIVGITFTQGCSYLAKEDVTVKIDGEKVDFDVQPQIIDGRVMVPLRKIFETLGASVKWNDESQTVSARKSSKTVSMTVNSAELTVDRGDTDENGNAVTDTSTLDVPAQVISDRVLVPVRAVSEAFGLEANWDNGTQTVEITSEQEDESWKENKGTIDLDTLTYTGNGVEIDGKNIKITEGGDFTVSGTLDGGNITVDTESRVKIRLDGASITTSGSPCIYVENADKAYITQTDKTENYLTVNSSENGAVYSKDNLEIKGNGTLYVNSDTGHGIKASDNLTIEDGTVDITAKNDAIHVNDTFKMTGGTVKSVSEGDGIDSESIVKIDGGTVDIKTTAVPVQTGADSAQNGRTDSSDSDFETSSKGIKADWLMSISGGDITVNSADHAIHCADEIDINGGNLSLNSEYGKGISAHGNLTVDGENTVIDIEKSTEGLESKNILTVNNGDIKIVSSDDGINATVGNSGTMPGGMNMGGMRPNGANRTDGQDNGDMQTPPEKPSDGDMQELPEKPGDGDMQTPPEKPDNGDMQELPEMPGNGDMQNPPERPNNGERPQFNGGNRPDFENGGQNGGGRPQRDFGNAPNENGEIGGNNGGNGSRYKDCLVINGGNIEIYAEDDCLDSNGNLIVNGGVIKAVKTDGTFAGPFGVFDPDGTLTVNEGATVIAVCLNGEQQRVNTAQNTLTVYFDNRHSSGEKIEIKNESGNVILDYTPNGDYKTAFITSPLLESGKTYTVSAGSEVKTAELSEQSTTVGTKSNSGTNGRFDRKNSLSNSENQL